MADKAYINPQVLKWARETAKFTLEAASTKSKISIENLTAWESVEADAFPTISQAEKLAKLYRRPLAVLYLPIIPKDFQTLSDFRSDGKGDYSTALVFMMREIQEKQQWLKDAMKDTGEEPLNFVGKFMSKSNAKAIAEDIRKMLDIHTNDFGKKTPLRYWIDKAESKRIFISLSSNIHSRLKLDSSEIKGFAIADQYAPFIFINSQDWDNAQLFTLVHELAHIWINASGVSNNIEINFRDKSNINPVELLCNEVAATALIPQNDVANLLKGQIINFNAISQVSKVFGVSNLTMINRLYGLNEIDFTRYEYFKTEANSQYQLYAKREEQKQESSDGSPNFYILQARRNGKAFAKIVLDFYKGGYITGLEASNLLNVKINNFQKFENYVYR